MKKHNLKNIKMPSGREAELKRLRDQEYYLLACHSLGVETDYFMLYTCRRCELNMAEFVHGSDVMDLVRKLHARNREGKMEGYVLKKYNVRYSFKRTIWPVFAIVKCPFASPQTETACANRRSRSVNTRILRFSDF